MTRAGSGGGYLAGPMLDRRRLFALMFAMDGGILLGLLSWGGDQVDVETPLRLVALLANLAAPWVLVAFLLGWYSRQPGWGALSGGLACLIGVSSYYVLHLVTGTRAAIGSQGVTVWVVVGAVVGPLMGWCGGMVAERRDRAPLLAAAIPAGALLAEAVWLIYSTGTWRLTRFGWIDTLVIVALVVAAVVLTRRAAGADRSAAALFAAGAVGIGGVVALAVIRLAVL